MNLTNALLSVFILLASNSFAYSLLGTKPEHKIEDFKPTSDQWEKTLNLLSVLETGRDFKVFRRKYLFEQKRMSNIQKNALASFFERTYDNTRKTQKTAESRITVLHNTLIQDYLDLKIKHPNINTIDLGDLLFIFEGLKSRETQTLKYTYDENTDLKNLTNETYTQFLGDLLKVIDQAKNTDMHVDIKDGLDIFEHALTFHSLTYKKFKIIRQIAIFLDHLQSGDILSDKKSSWPMFKIHSMNTPFKNTKEYSLITTGNNPITYTVSVKNLPHKIIEITVSSHNIGHLFTETRSIQ